MRPFATREAYREAWAKAGTEDPLVPLNVDLELASICNLECPMCFIPDPNFDAFIKTKSPDGGPRRRLMPTELAFRIIQECAEIGVPALKFNWRGESTLHPDYSKIVYFAATQRNIVLDRELVLEGHEVDSGPAGGLTLRSDSKALSELWEKASPSFFDLLANTNANCRDHALSGLMATTKCMVSLDSLVPDTYAKMRVGGNLERVKEIVRELIRRGHTNLWVRRVLTKENQHEPFYWQAREEFGEAVHVSEHFCIDRNAVATYETGECEHDRLPRTYCEYPSQRIVIASSGLCYPCCLDLHETMPIGDIKQQSLTEIWEGRVVKRLRMNLRKDDPREWSKTCQACESWKSYAVPQRAFVQDHELSDEKPTIVGLVNA